MANKELIILYATETGNCEGLAQKVAIKAEKNGVQATVTNLESYAATDLIHEKAPMLFIVSTWGDGSPPPKAEAFFDALYKEMLLLTEKPFAVLALGDSEYPLFCECGKRLDAYLESCHAARLMPREDLDGDYMVSYMGWSKRFWQVLDTYYSTAA